MNSSHSHRCGAVIIRNCLRLRKVPATTSTCAMLTTSPISHFASRRISYHSFPSICTRGIRDNGNHYGKISEKKLLSSSSSAGGGAASGDLFAVVDHSEAYDEAMAGRHGRQLALAYNEGIGKEETFHRPEDYDDGSVGDREEDDSADEEEEEDEMVLSKYDNPRLTPSERAALRVGAPAGGLFAVVRLVAESSQFKVTIDDTIICNKLKPVDKWRVGAVITLTADQILLMASSDKTLVGLPHILGAEVDVRVEEITHDKTIIVFKKRRRKHSRRKNGFRREVTFLRVLDIRMPKEIAHDSEKGNVI